VELLSGVNGGQPAGFSLLSDLASYLRIEERELEAANVDFAGGRGPRG